MVSGISGKYFLSFWILLFFFGIFCEPGIVAAKSAYSPRHSGMEAPGGPRPLEALPGRTVGRTAEGGLGYTDAYGNTVDRIEQEEKTPRKRLRPGAYGSLQNSRQDNHIPDPTSKNNIPVWNFNK